MDQNSYSDLNKYDFQADYYDEIYSDIYIKGSLKALFEFKEFMEEYLEKFDIPLIENNNFPADNRYFYIKLHSWVINPLNEKFNFIKDFMTKEGIRKKVVMVAIQKINILENSKLVDFWGYYKNADINISFQFDNFKVEGFE